MVTSDTLRGWALELPEATEEETWGAATFRVRSKIFAILRAEEGVVTLKASIADQAELIAGDAQTYRIAPHTGRFGWVQVTLASADPTELRSVVLEAWRRTAPKRLQITLPDDLKALLPVAPGVDR